MADEFSRLDELERCLEVLHMALDGNRTLQRDGKGAFTESSASVVKEIRAVAAEIEAVKKAQPNEGSGFDELKQRRASRGQSDSQRRASPRRNRDKRSG